MQLKRIIGEYTQKINGPLLICTAGVHGNEIAGIKALERVFKKLEEKQIAIKGSFIGLIGNIEAIKVDKRFIERDLNRIWDRDHMEFIKASPINELTRTEDKEQKALIEIINNYLHKPHTRFLFLDLHTTSASGGVFSIASDNHVSKDLALKLKVPVIISFEDVLKGTTLNYFNHLGLEAIGFEAGQHYDESSIDNIEAAVMLLLAEEGCIEESTLPELEIYHKLLENIGKGLPKLVEFRYRHDIKQDDHFKMEPGFSNFQKVNAGTLLAHDIHGEIRAKENGMILMPLYQKQGEDGFFIIKPIDY